MRTKINRKNKKKNNCMDFSSDKLATSHTRKFGHGYQRKNLKRETESLPIVAQNNAIRTNYVKAKIDKTQQNSRCRLYGDRNETINYILTECSTLALREYKTRYHWVGIHWELCKKFQFDHTKKWYMHNPESVLKNETYKILWDFEIQTDHLISTRRPAFVPV